METITKEKIAEQLKTKLGFSINVCTEITEHICTELVYLTTRDKKTVIQNFGTWKINHKKPRPGFNIKSGEQVLIDSRTVLRFLPAKKLKQQINE